MAKDLEKNLNEAKNEEQKRMEEARKDIKVQSNTEDD